MEQIGWSLVDGETELEHWGDTPGECVAVPSLVRLPNGDHVHCPQPGEIQAWKLLPRFHDLANSATVVVDPDKVVVQTTPTPEMIVAERVRRLGLGFNYDFGDVRGVHRIGTSPADMIGWGEVSTYAGALLDSGDVTTQIAIVTDTGPCHVTAPEWRAIEIAAAVFRQPIWARSFVLSALLPTDYTSDAQWS